jgi:O-antigen ligase
MMQPARRGASDRRLASSEWAAVIGLCSVMITSQLMIGGGDNLTALGITLIYGSTCAVLAATRWATPHAYRLGALAVPGACFVLVILTALASMGSIQLDPAHSVWRLIGRANSASIDHSTTLIEILKLMGLGCIFLAGFVTGGSYTRVRAVLKALSGFASVFGLIAIFTFVGAPTTIMGFGAKLLFQDRLTASFLSANTAGTFFGTCLLLALGEMLVAFRRARIRRASGAWVEYGITGSVPPAIAILIAMTALLLSQSRTAMVATGAMVVLLILAEGLIRRWRLRTLIATLAPILLLGSLAATFIGGGAVLQRLSLLQGDTVVRAHIYQAHASTMRLYPWTGFGLGTFDEVNRSLLLTRQADYGDLWVVRAMHNVYMQWIEGAGWLGALPMFAVVTFLLLRIGFSAVRYRDRSTQLLTILAISGLILLHGLTDFALENPSVAGWWAMLLGIGLAISNRGDGARPGRSGVEQSIGEGRPPLKGAAQSSTLRDFMRNFENR